MVAVLLLSVACAEAVDNETVTFWRSKDSYGRGSESLMPSCAVCVAGQLRTMVHEFVQDNWARALLGAPMCFCTRQQARAAMARTRA